ncbi:hypothetical protein JG687_00007534 [Phytophthora cactorum]|uniref:Uncharacterized protein n=1 Tax=Phytophthora cactorum TaxID=29920 RepID=A0A329SBH7_9STRA|nr:hypothetical protein PC112_g7804 [Phytophthora cactorum]KAG4240919.1 hypothetical protein PC116_g11147 [Phytophthora cactorum]KAG6961748.1 hypothetical protein JG687_00007534 [Phytophthora cactorum]RAW32988.1 hypothetical protein PC110_g10695 [Phytophthora cactorum]
MAEGLLQATSHSFRASTRQRQESPEDSATAVEELDETMEETMYNLDVETPIFFEYVPKRSLNSGGALAVWVRSGGKCKEWMTCMLLSSSHGKKCTPFFVIETRASKVEARDEQNRRLRHGFGKTRWKKIKVLQDSNDVQNYGNSTGW